MGIKLIIVKKIYENFLYKKMLSGMTNSEIGKVLSALSAEVD